MVFKIYLAIFLSISILIAKPFNIIGADLATVFDSDGQGREARIIESIFSCMKSKFQLQKAPYGRHILWFNQNKKLGALATAPPGSKAKGFKSNPHIYYNNGVTVLKSKNIKVTSLKDLKGLRVISFVDAPKLFKGLREAIPTFKSYQENSNQELHSKMLFHDRVDAVISDGLIFAKYTKILREKDPQNRKNFAKTKFFQIFEPTPFHMVFRDKNTRDKFNSCLKAKKSTIEKINYEHLLEEILN